MPFSPASPPLRGGDYSRFVTKAANALPPSSGSTVCISYTDDWGPYRIPTLYQSFAEYLDAAGQPSNPAAPSEGYIAVYNAFKGEGAEFPGAGAVLGYRHGGAAAAKASRNLVAGLTPIALTITAAHQGVRGNEYKVAVVANATDPTNKVDVKIYLGNVVLRTYENIGSADIVNLQTEINRTMFKDVVASGAVNGTKLDVLTATALTGGNSGATMVAADWTATRDRLETENFGFFVPANLTDVSIRASLVAWAAALNAAEKSKRFELFEGGAAGEVFSTASARSFAANNPNVANVGTGTYRDKALGLELSTAQLAPRIAGIAAARGGQASLSFAYLEDLEIVVGPTEVNILDSLDEGVIVLVLGTGGVRIERGVTTYTTTTDADVPFDVYSRLKYVVTMQSFERDGKEANENGRILGRLAVNDDTREFIVGREQQRLNEYIERGEVRVGGRVQLSTNPPPSDDDEFIAIDWIGKFSRSLEQIRRTIYFN